MTEPIARQVVVHGLVQGVFFRDSCQREAQRHGVAGWVRNMPDGTLRAAFEGEPEAVRYMVEWVHQGPPYADVDHVDVEDDEPAGEAGFRVL